MHSQGNSAVGNVGVGAGGAGSPGCSAPAARGRPNVAGGKHLDFIEIGTSNFETLIGNSTDTSTGKSVPNETKSKYLNLV